MSTFAGIMTGSCKIVTPGSGTWNDFGEYVPGNDVELGPFPCYFFQPKGSIIDIQSGEHVKRGLRVMLPDYVSVSVGQTIRGLVTGYDAPYTVLSVEPAHHFDVLDHWECDLEVVV